MAEELTYADYEKAQADLDKIKAELEAKGMEFVDEGGKPLYKSKIFWANIIAMGVTFAGAFGFQLSAEESTALLGAVIPAVNIVLRYFGKDITGVVN